MFCKRPLPLTSPAFGQTSVCPACDIRKESTIFALAADSGRRRLSSAEYRSILIFSHLLIPSVMHENETLTTIRSRRSTRSYQPRPVAEEDLKTIAEAATWAPSGMSRHTYRFLVVSKPELLEELNRRIRSAFRRSEREVLRQRGENEQYCCYYHAPALIIACNEPTEAWAAQDCACALQNMFLSACSLGLASCWINQLSNGISDEPEVHELLTEWGMPEGYKVYGCAAIGYPAQPIPEGAPRKDGLVRWVE